MELTAQEGEQDISLVDAFRLTYWHTYMADHDALRFGATGQQRVTIQGFSSPAIRVLDVTYPDRVWEVAGVVEPQDAGFAVTLSVPGTGARTFLKQPMRSCSHCCRLACRWKKSPATRRAPPPRTGY